MNPLEEKTLGDGHGPVDIENPEKEYLSPTGHEEDEPAPTWRRSVLFTIYEDELESVYDIKPADNKIQLPLQVESKPAALQTNPADGAYDALIADLVQKLKNMKISTPKKTPKKSPKKA
ncbi:hypothetical protein TWF696_003512 [Orbilia brochopaga]|uniref:Uncharacterized protein n=1 Tax=Orbilia brochopaga TaxID=3140254 RepID=A0AAV9U1K2_9PEZI